MTTPPDKQSLPYVDDRYCYTSHLYLAAYLYAQGLELINVDQDSAGKVMFTFLDRAERETWSQAFRHGPEAPVDARKFTLALTELRQRVRKATGERKPVIEL
jgi:hypothetical protein